MSENKTTAAADPHAGGKEMITDVFVRGARQGWGIAIGSMIPNVLMAFVIITTQPPRVSRPSSSFPPAPPRARSRS